MTKMQKIAKRLNAFFKIADIFYGIAVVLLAVALVATVGISFAGLPSDLAKTPVTSLSLGDYELTIASDYAPGIEATFRSFLPAMPTTLVGILLGWMFLHALQRLMDSVAEGVPFSEGAWKELRKMAWLTMAQGVVSNLTTALIHWGEGRFLDVEGLLAGEKILAVSHGLNFDLSFLIYGFVLLLLAYVFRYGTELQVQVDETV